MILETIQVEGFQRFAAPFTLGPLEEGINIVSGPNGSGKSTLVRALVRALLDSHRGGGRAMEALRPRGRDLTPKVTVEFRHGGMSYRVHKRFLDKPEALLDRKEHGEWQPAAEGDAAATRLREMLRAENRDWGIGAALWSPQGGIALSPLRGDVLAEIQQSLGAQLLPPRGRAIEAGAFLRYSEYYTLSGKLRGGRGAPPVAALEQEITAARSRVEEARARMREIESASAALAALDREREPLEVRRKEAEHAAVLIEASASRYEELDRERQKLDLERRAAEAEYHGRQERVARARSLETQREQLRQRLDETTGKRQELTARITRKRADKQQATEALWRVSREDGAARWRVEFRAGAPLQLRVDEGEPRGEHSLQAGESIEIAGSGPLEFLAGGPGTVRVEENTDAARHEERLRLAQDRVAAIGMELTQAEKEKEWLDGDAASRGEELAAVERDIAAASQQPEADPEEAALRWHATKAALEKVLAEQAALPGGRPDRQHPRRHLEAADEALRRNRERILAEQAVLRRMIAAAPYDQLAAAEERLSALEDRLRSERQRMDAVHLLWRTIEECKSEAIEGLHEPVGREAARLLARIIGAGAASIALTSDFEPVGVGEFQMAELSGGEAEQVYLATRLALAHHLARGTRQLVVLDDVLTATDPRRLERIGELLAEESAKLQFLILTCHPERYRKLGRVWELPASGQEK